MTSVFFDMELGQKAVDVNGSLYKTVTIYFCQWNFEGERQNANKIDPTLIRPLLLDSPG